MDARHPSFATLIDAESQITKKLSSMTLTDVIQTTTTTTTAPSAAVLYIVCFMRAKVINSTATNNCLDAKRQQITQHARSTQQGHLVRRPAARHGTSRRPTFYESAAAAARVVQIIAGNAGSYGWMDSRLTLTDTLCRLSVCLSVCLFVSVTWLKGPGYDLSCVYTIVQRVVPCRWGFNMKLVRFRVSLLLTICRIDYQERYELEGFAVVRFLGSYEIRGLRQCACTLSHFCCREQTNIDVRKLTICPSVC